MSKFKAIQVASIKDDDLVFALMGPTGSGKSTIISTLTGLKGLVGNGLESRTDKVVGYRGQYKGKSFVLVDTPGFDDTYKSDVFILTLVSDWLKATYGQGKKLDGILYLHPITDNRMRGSTLRNLKMFGSLCGDKLTHRVALVTTMWDLVKDHKVADGREAELKNQFWGQLIDYGCTVVRFDKEMPWSPIDDIIIRNDPHYPALLQEEIVDLNRQLSETEAGKSVYSSLLKSMDDHRNLLIKLEAYAKENNNAAEAEHLRAEIAKANKDIQTTFEQLQKLKVSFGRRIALWFSRRAHAKSIKWGDALGV